MTADATTPAIEVDDLTVRRGGRAVLQDVTFQIRRGDIVGLLGPSGCGKSTLMRALVGVQREVSGTCTLIGEPAGSPSLRTRVGYMTQDASVFGDLTVLENLRYFASVVGAPEERVERVLVDVDLVAERDRLVDTLSNGQHHRVSLAVALLAGPELLILDEPTVGLDPVLRRDLWRLFRQLAVRGTTLLVSSHVMDEARECDRILMMRDGRLLADDTEAALLRQTGTTDISDAFMALVGADASAPATAAAATPVAVSPRHLRILAATAGRVLRQLRHDPRSVALMLLPPVVLLGLLAWVLSGQPGVFDRWGALLLAIFPLLLMFVLTSVATLRERTRGTLERLMTMPLNKADFLFGYGLAFGLAAVAQAAIACAFTFGPFGLTIAAPVAAVALVAVLNGLLGTSLGLFASAFARTEFQAVQMLPMVLLPQFVLCGIIAPTASMPQPLRAISYGLPLTYSIDAMKQLTIHAAVTGSVWRDVAVLVAFIVAVVAAGAATLDRRTP
jgi:ABC-2 type transport system ATP-binding protein/ABC-2 type transport system permease protein